MQMCIISSLLSFLIFAIIGAARLNIISAFNWDMYWILRAGSFLLFSAIIWQGRFKLQPIIGIKKKKIVPLRCGDPLLFLRAAACIFVLFQHGAGVAFPPTNLEKIIWQDFIWLLYPSAWVGVWIFFTLSGYLMGKGFFNGRYNLSADGILSFYRNRILKIVPLYYLAILAVSFFLTPNIFEKKNIWMLVSILLFDYDGSLPISPISALWSVATEMQFYLIAPFLAAGLASLFKKHNFKFYLTFMVILTTIYMLYRLINFIDGGHYWYTSVYTSLLGNLDLFIGGMVLAFIIQRAHLKPMPIVMGILIISLMYITSAYFVAKIESGSNYLGPFSYWGPVFSGYATLFVIFIFETATIQGKNPGLFSSFCIRSAQFFGILTYAIYVFHEPIYMTMHGSLTNKVITVSHTLQLLLIGVGKTIFLALLAYYFIEKPFLKLRAKSFLKS